MSKSKKSGLFDQEKLKNSIDQMFEGIQVIDRNFRYLYVNKAVTEHGKKSPEELLGKTMMECYPGIENTEVFNRIKSCLRTGEISRMENKFDFDDGSHEWFELLFQPHPDGVLIRSLDITERKKLEFQYWQTQKMNALGKLTAQISHDLNNKLSIMALCGSNLAHQKDLSDKSQKLVFELLKTVEESRNFIERLTGFVTNDFNEPSSIDINDFLVKSRDQYRKLFPGNITINFALESDLPKVLIGPSMIDQVVLNLLVNARDAMPNGGDIEVTTGIEQIAPDEKLQKAGILPGKYIKLSVTDSGCGINEDVFPHIFDPFFTTKKNGKGTGLGLSVVSGIVRQLKGHVAVESQDGNGTTFKLFFPIAS